MSMKKALVTGATGYIGSYVVARLLETNWEVHVLARPSSNIMKLADPVQKAIKVHLIPEDEDYLGSLMADIQPEVVFHLASLFLVDHNSTQVSSLIESNVLFGTQLLEAMSASCVQYFINTSSYWVHYCEKKYLPANLYAATKQAFCDILEYYVDAKGIRAITLELFDTYGPNDPRPKLLNLLLRIANTGELLAMSPGEQKIDLVHIDDVVEAYMLAAKRLLDTKVSGHEVYGVGTKNPITLKKMVAEIQQQTGRTLNIQWGGRPYRSREVFETWQNYQVIPGWAPKIRGLQIKDMDEWKC